MSKLYIYDMTACCAWFYVWSGGEDVLQACATIRARTFCCQTLEWQFSPIVSCLSLYLLLFSFNLSFFPSLPLCRVIKFSCSFLDVIQRHFTVIAVAFTGNTHTHSTHTDQRCVLHMSICRTQVRCNFMLSVSRSPGLRLSDWEEIIVIAALSHPTSFLIASLLTWLTSFLCPLGKRQSYLIAFSIILRDLYLHNELHASCMLLKKTWDHKLIRKIFTEVWNQVRSRDIYSNTSKKPDFFFAASGVVAGIRHPRPTCSVHLLYCLISTFTSHLLAFFSLTTN